MILYRIQNYLLRKSKIHRIKRLQKKFRVEDLVKYFKEFDIYLALNPESYIDWICLSEDNLYESSYVNSMIKLIQETKNISQEESLFFDLGANIGIYSNAIAKKCNIQCHAFEPVESLYRKIKVNKELNSLNNLVINKLAVGDSQKSAIPMFSASVDHTHFNKKNEGMNSLVENSEKFRFTENIIELVNQTDLDSYFQIHNIQSTTNLFIKIDVEEYEEKVLLGMNKIFESHTGKISIQIEMLLGEERVRNIYLSCISMFEKFKFDPYLLLNNEWRKESYSRIKELSNSSNILFRR